MTSEGNDRSSHTTSTGHDFSSPDWLDNHYLAMQPEYEAMLRWVGLEPGWHVLDAGCGSGSYLPLLRELVGRDGALSAIDLAPENIRAAREKALGRSSGPFILIPRGISCVSSPFRPCRRRASRAQFPSWGAL